MLVPTTDTWLPGLRGGEGEKFFLFLFGSCGEPLERSTKCIEKYAFEESQQGNSNQTDNNEAKPFGDYFGKLAS